MTKLQYEREKKFSRNELTEMLGFKPQLIRQYEQGFRNIDGANIKTLAKIAKALDCRISDIIEETETVNILHELNQ